MSPASAAEQKPTPSKAATALMNTVFMQVLAKARALLILIHHQILNKRQPVSFQSGVVILAFL
jgi:hypothetical protein